MDQTINNTVCSIPQFPTSHKNVSFDKIVELRDKGLSVGQIGKLLGCSKTTIIYHLRYNGYDKDIVNTYKKNRPDIFAWMQERLVSSISDEDIKKTPVGSRVLAVAQLYDKERLESDQSSANIAHQISIAPEIRHGLSMVSSKMDKAIEVSGGDNQPDNRDDDGLEDE